MQDTVRVALDAMGGDNAPSEIVKGAIEAVNDRDNLKVFLVGKETLINEELCKYTYNKEQIEVVTADEIIEFDESPVLAIRRKKNSSIVIALNLVKNKQCDAFVSAGSTGAILAGGQFIVGRSSSSSVNTNTERCIATNRLWCERGCTFIALSSIR